MKKIVVIMLFAVCAGACGMLRAQESADTVAVASIVERINASGSIDVHHPAALDVRLHNSGRAADSDEQAQETKTTQQGRVGYRIQVFDDNNPRTARTEAQNRKRLMESRFPELHTYMQFNSPYWRVKTGDFRSRSEAEAMLEEMRQAFPYMGSQLRIVRDRINIAE